MISSVLTLCLKAIYSSKFFCWWSYFSCFRRKVTSLLKGHWQTRLVQYYYLSIFVREWVSAFFIYLFCYIFKVLVICWIMWCRAGTRLCTLLCENEVDIWFVVDFFPDTMTFIFPISSNLSASPLDCMHC